MALQSGESSASNSFNSYLHRWRWQRYTAGAAGAKGATGATGAAGGASAGECAAGRVMVGIKADGSPKCREPDIKTVRQVGSSSVAVAKCPADYIMTDCSGAREKDLPDSGDESDRGFIGAIPLNNNSECRATADSAGDEVVAVAACIKF